MEKSSIIAYSFLALGVTAVTVALVTSPKSKTQAYLDSNMTPQNRVFNSKKIAETLFDAMKVINLTNDKKNEIIFGALTGVTEAQFGLVFKAFGSRRYNTYTGNTLGIYTYNLATWLKSELSPSSYRQLQEFYPKYL